MPRKKGSKKGQRLKKAASNDIADAVKEQYVREDVSTVGDQMHCGEGYVEAAVEGCHIAHLDADWILGVEELNMDDYGGIDDSQLPEISICPDSEIMTVINSNTIAEKSFFITVPLARLKDNTFDVVLRGRDEKILKSGTYRNEDGSMRECITLVAVVAPRSVMDLCYIEFRQKCLNDLNIFSDVKDLSLARVSQSNDPQKTTPIRFPLLTSSESPKFLCTQEFGGKFTHFYPATYYAVDIQCPVGTPIVAVGDGIVTSLRDDSTVGGIHARNLFHWNSVTIQLTNSGKFVEYVHIKKNSVTVKVGDTVREGEIICLSGDVGFCPAPHLHIQVHDSDADDAPTVPFVFVPSEVQTDAELERFFVPRAGEWCPKPIE